jgi:hypothetical protein
MEKMDRLEWIEGIRMEHFDWVLKIKISQLRSGILSERAFYNLMKSIRTNAYAKGYSDGLHQSQRERL